MPCQSFLSRATPMRPFIQSFVRYFTSPAQHINIRPMCCSAFCQLYFNNHRLLRSTILSIITASSQCRSRPSQPQTTRASVRSENQTTYVFTAISRSIYTDWQNSRTPNRGSHMGPIRWACDSCHRSKWKCDEDGPSCGNCVRSSRDCTYSFRDKPAASATKTKTAPIAPRTPRVLLPKPTSPAVSESCNTIDPGGPPPIQDQPVYSAPSYMYHDTWYSTFNTESPQSLGNLGSSPTLQYPFQYPLQYPLLSPEDQTMTSTMQPMVSGNSRRDIADLRHSTPRMSKPRKTMLEQEALST